MREHIVGGIGFETAAVINYALGFQTTRNWNLYETDFTQFFEYGWEKESVLSAISAIPKPITQPWMWTFDTNAYPFRLSLKRIDKNKPAPDFWIQGGKNLVRVTDNESNLHITTRIYPFGYGEGINQLTIEGVNNGVPFIQSPPEIVAKYGLISRVMVDRRYKLPGELMDYAKQMLSQLQEPHNEYEVDFAMINNRQRPKLGDLVEIRDELNQPIERNIITGIKVKYEETEKISINIANRPRDIAGTLADMIDRQRIETSYAQGATQFFTDHVHENASQNTPAVMRVFIPDSMVWINNVVIDVRMRGFRAPFDVTQGGGAVTQSSGPSSMHTTASTVATVASSTTNNQTTPSTTQQAATQTTALDTGLASLWNTSLTSPITWLGARITGGGQAAAGHTHQTTEANLNHTHRTHLVVHTHPVTIPAHSHSVTIPGHSHNITIPAHSHSMEHTHNTTLPNHVHTLVPNIRHIGSPNSFTIRINGINVQTVNGTSLQRDITLQLADPTVRAIRRNHFHTIEVIPNAHAYIELTLSMQFFIQSKGAHKL